MQKFEWLEKYSVGVKQIDEHHKKIIAVTNDLAEAIRAGVGGEAIDNVVQELLNYVKFHFAYEQEYFDKLEYPDSQKHKLEHLEFTKKVISIYQNYAKGQGLLASDLLRFICDWLQSHFMGTDQEFGRRLQVYLSEEEFQVEIKR